MDPLIITDPAGRSINMWDSETFDLPLNPKRIGVELSGGTDSAAVLILLCEQFKDQDVEFVPITRNSMDAYEYTPFAERVAEAVSKLYPNAKILDNEAFYGVTRPENRLAKVVDELNIDIVFGGQSLAPPIEELHALRDTSKSKIGFSYEYLAEFRTLDNPYFSKTVMTLAEDAADEEERGFLDYTVEAESADSILYYKPLLHVDKKFIRYVFELYDPEWKVFLLTRSCAHHFEPGSPNYEHLRLGQESGADGMIPCKRCFQCLEKKWAFGVYDFGVE